MKSSASSRLATVYASIPLLVIAVLWLVLLRDPHAPRRFLQHGRRRTLQTMGDAHDLRRFVLAQEGVYDTAVRELRAGRKLSHWMWFVFPQIAGLGHSAMSQKYAIGSLAEAEAYVAHPVLGPRLLECARILTALTGTSARGIFGAVDAQKLRSSMTLFARAAPEQRVFADVLAQYFDSAEDPATLERL